MSKVKLNEAGEAHCRCLIRAGKVNDGPWGFDAGDRAKLLGPKGNHVEEYARHHLGVQADEEDDNEDEERDLDSGSGGGAIPTIGIQERYKHPFAKDGQVYTRALKSIRSQAAKYDHPEVLQSAGTLLDLIREEQLHSDGDSDRSLNPNREVRCLMAGVQLRAAADGKGPGTAFGYAAVFDRFSEDLGYFRETIAPGAFEGCLGQDVRALVNHDPNQLIGRTKSGTLRIEEDGVGLRVECDLPDTQTGRDTATSIRRGDLDGMSFSFDTEADSWDRSTTPPTRTLLRCRRVYDVGPVAFPAYEDTTAAMRSLDRSKPLPVLDPIATFLSLALARQRLAEASTPL